MEQLRQWLEPALDRGGNTHSFDDVMAEIKAEKMQLWTGPKGAAVTLIYDYPLKRVLHVFLAGGELEQVKDFVPSMEVWGRAMGCTEMTLAGRRGWSRVLDGWKPVLDVLAKEI